MRYIIALCVLLVSCTAPVADAPTSPRAETEIATFAGGCFWCMEAPFEELEGVREVISGYGGGTEEFPTYKNVSSGTTGHVESVQVHYDPNIISYEELLDVFWRQINPTDDGGQFVDRGFQYTTAIFYHNEEQRLAAEASKATIASFFDEEIVTPVKAFTSFYHAEEYHQDYYKKNSIKYKYYRSRSGRDNFLESVWGEEEQ